MIKILAIGAHNDEIMCNMGGLAHILHQKGCDQLFLNLACQWNDDKLSEAEKHSYIEQENRAAEILGGKFMCIGNRDDILFLESKEIIDQTTKIIVDYAPDIIFLHWPRDNHAEHRAVAQVSYKAMCAAHVRGARFKEAYAFEGSAKQTMDYFSPDFFIDIGDSWEYVKQSITQFDQNFANGDYLYYVNEQQRLCRGIGAQCKYAEAFKFVKFPDGSDDILLKQLVGDKFRWKGNGHYPAFGEYYF